MSQPSTATPSTSPAAVPKSAEASTGTPAAPLSSNGEPILCNHCGRTASNGISCEGYCVADSGY